MLSTTNQTLALQYLSTCIDSVATFNEILQLVVVELVHKVGRRGEISSFVAIVPGAVSPSCRLSFEEQSPHASFPAERNIRQGLPQRCFDAIKVHPCHL
jgi:hypothetical protein